VPFQQIATLARDLSARAVAISVSVASRGSATTAALRKLREELPRRVLLVVGGDGAPSARPGVTTFSNLRDLDVWARRFAAGMNPPAGPDES
jgi:hypothetical protein